MLRLMPHDVLTFVGCLSVLSGMFVSRAMMSIGMMTLFGSAILNIHLKEKFKTFLHQPHLLMLTGYFFIVLISYFWSDNIPYFIERLRNLLPFLVLPFAFHVMNKPETKWMDFLLLFFVTLTTLGIFWSLYHYIQNKEMYDLGYGTSQVIPTPFKQDHIRFSMAVVMSICFSIDLMIRQQKNWIKILLTCIAIFSVVYLHILSVKTGLVSFYFIAFIFSIRLIFQKQYRKPALAFVALLISLPFLMYTVSTSFRNKVSYINYSIYQIRNDNQEPNISDEGRIISYRYALGCIHDNPWIGIGAGDIMDVMKNYYDKDFPNQQVKVLVPHNQFLMAGMEIGLFGIIYLIILQVLLFRLSFKHDFLYFAFLCMMFLAMMIEPLYETQIGTCIFLFFLLLLLQRRTRTE